MEEALAYFNQQVFSFTNMVYLDRFFCALWLLSALRTLFYTCVWALFVLVSRAGTGRGGGLEGAAEACMTAGIPFIVVVRPHTLVSKRAVKVIPFINAPKCRRIIKVTLPIQQ